jgi:hypothetical protein
MRARSDGELLRFLIGLAAVAAFAGGSFVLGWAAYG